MNIMVTGGAGYIGSHMCTKLVDEGYNVIIVDNLSTGHQELLHAQCHHVKADISDRPTIEKVLTDNKIEAVIHFAAFIRVEESVAEPLKYYRNNTGGTLNLLEACQNTQVKKFIFSSTAAVYGDGDNKPIKEEFPTQALNPYGRSKLMSEQILRDVAQQSNLKFAILRYFNVSGAHTNGQLGQISKNSTHLIKIAAETAVGLRAEMFLYGTDYPTPDGTCYRDYIHILDLIEAHYCALKYLDEGPGGQIFNLGYGKGLSVREVIHSMKKVSGSNFRVVETDRRPGDGQILVADSHKAQRLLHWQPKYNNIDTICLSAYKWEKHLATRRKS